MPSGESSTLSVALDERRPNIPGGTAARSNSLRDVLRIGQVWERCDDGCCMRIKQIHRADRIVEASFATPEACRPRAVTFAELRRSYTLVD